MIMYKENHINHFEKKARDQYLKQTAYDSCCSWDTSSLSPISFW